MVAGRWRLTIPLAAGLALLGVLACLVRPTSPNPDVPRATPQNPLAPRLPETADPASAAARDTAALSGTVILARNRAPLPFATVLVTGGGFRRSATADAQGRFSFPALPAVSVEVSAAVHDCSWRSAARKIDLRNGIPEALTLEVSGLCLLSGRVVTGDGRTPASFGVRAVFPSDGPELLHRFSGVDFQFLVDPSHPRVLLSADAPGYAASPPLAVDPRDREEISGLELRLTAGAVVTGRVIDEAGLPVRDARVNLRPEPGGFEAPLQATSGSDGTFTCPRGAAGTYTLRAAKSGYVPALLENLVLAEGMDPAAVTLRLSKGWNVGGRLLDPSGQPISGGSVSVKEGLQEVRVGTGPDGRFDVSGIEPAEGDANRSPNIDILQGSAKGYGSVSLTDVPPGSVIQLTLPVAGQLTVHARGSEGALPSTLPWTAKLSLRQAQHPQDRGAGLEDIAHQVRGPAVTIGNLAPGTYDLEVSASGRTTVQQPGLRIVAQQTLSLEIVLLAGKSDVPILDFDLSTPDDLRTKLPGVLEGYTDEARDQILVVLRGLYAANTPERAALEEVVRKFKRTDK